VKNTLRIEGGRRESEIFSLSTIQCDKKIQTSALWREIYWRDIYS